MNRATRLFFRFTLCLIGLSLPVVAKCETPPDKRLIQKVSVNFQKQSVETVIKDLGKKCKLPVEFDASVAGEGLGQGTFTLKADGIMLDSVLKLACGSEHLVYRVEKGRLIISTEIGDEKNMVVRDHSLAELEEAFATQLPKFLELFSVGLMYLSDAKWEFQDGEGGKILGITPQSIQILQTPAGHAQVASLVEQMGAAIAGRPVTPPAHEKGDQVLLRKLKIPQAYMGGKAKLPDLFDKTLSKNGIAYWVDSMALKDAKIDWEELESTVEAKKVATSVRLDAIAAEHQLLWYVSGEVVQITSPAKLNQQMVVRIYDLSKSSTPKPRPIVVYNELYRDKSLGPWAIDDGEGGYIFPFGSLLVIKQYPKSHAAIEKLLQ